MELDFFYRFQLTTMLHHVLVPATISPTNISNIHCAWNANHSLSQVGTGMGKGLKLVCLISILPIIWTLGSTLGFIKPYREQTFDKKTDK